MEKDFSSGAYWYAFGEGVLLGANRPTPKEAADHISNQAVRIADLESQLRAARHEEKCAKQQFKVFAMEVSNLAAKHF